MPGTVDEPETAFLDPPHRDIGVRANAEVAERVLPHRARRVPRRPPNRSRRTEVPSARNLLITFGMSFMPPLMLATCISVEMTSGRKPSLMAGTAMRHAKLVCAVADVEQHAAFSRLPQGGIDLAGWVLLAAQARVHVRVDVARTQLARDELGERTLGFIGAEVDHHRQRRERAGFDGAFHGDPLGT